MCGISICSGNNKCSLTSRENVQQILRTQRISRTEFIFIEDVLRIRTRFNTINSHTCVLRYRRLPKSSDHELS